MSSNRRDKTRFLLLTAALFGFWLTGPGWVAAEDRSSGKADNKKTPAATKPAGKKKPQVRPITVAVFNLDVTKGVDIDPGALTDQINVLLDMLPKVTVVNRDQIAKAAEEHKMSLSGLVDSDTAAKLGKFVSAQYVIVGRASKIGATYYLVLKIVDVETTVQSIVSTKTSLDHGVETLIERLLPPLTHKVGELQRPTLNKADQAAFLKLKQAAAPLRAKTVLLDVGERHINRPLDDPAALMAVSHRLQSFGVQVVIPKDPPVGWKQALLDAGMYRDQKVDFLIEGEGISAFAAEIHGLVSCRARVELRLIEVPGRQVTMTEKGVDSHVDLVEALAAKSALERAATQATDALITRWAAQRKAPAPRAKPAPRRGG